MSEQKIEIDEAVVSAVAKEAAEMIAKTMEKPATAEEIAKAITEQTEKVAKKDIHEGDVVDKKVTTSAFAELPKEVRFAKGLIAFKNNDSQAIKEYNSYVDKAWMDVNKANYQNVTTTADGAALVPDPEFVAEVERLTDQYGVVARLADIRKTDRDSVTLLAGTNEISFTKAAEATAKNAQKLTYSATTTALDKYIATLVMTSEVIEDAAINLWDDATTEIARARAKLFDQLVFTDATLGLLYAPDPGGAYKTLSVGAALSNFDADDAMNAQYKVVSTVRAKSRFFMHPTVWNVIRQTKEATTGGYLFGAPGQGATPMIDGYPVELVDIMPESGAISANAPFAVFGDLSRIKVYVKRLLETKIFDSGTVLDAAGGSINLITQDAWAMRATLRCVPVTRFPGAFCIIGTGTVS
jgi:HK97 family phage major capsid protein